MTSPNLPHPSPPPRNKLSRLMAAIVLIWLLSISTYVILKIGGTL